VLLVALLGGKYLFDIVFGVKYPQLMAPTKRTPALGRINQYRSKARSDAQPYPQQHSQQSSDEDTPFPPNREPSVENNNSNMPVDIDVPEVVLITLTSMETVLVTKARYNYIEFQ
jgi:hypothetical protein